MRFDRWTRHRMAIALIGGLAILVTAAFNLYAAAVIASAAGSTLGQTLQLWLDGFSPDGLYSGRTLLSLERFETALLQLALLLVIAVWLYTLNAVARPRESSPQSIDREPRS